MRPTGALFFSAFIEADLEGFEDRDPASPLLYATYGEPLLRALLARNGWEVCGLYPKDLERFIQHHVVCRPR